MAYQTYITDALVCGGTASKTSDKSYLLFTREAGMVFASARSVREERSRQRYALQEFALIRASLIKGKTGWRIGSVEPKENYYHQAHDKAARGSVVTIFRQLRRFIHGEETHPELFDFIIASLQAAYGQITHRVFFDGVVQVQLMQQLGYVSAKNVSPELLKVAMDEVDSLYSEVYKVQLERVLKHAVDVSQL